ncbi:MAG: hypothetical protein D6790_14145 [Caldilineae bacterium]|nr:MAG: hypothetical protein D6790_14145 [Caldilineae bacterium]
MPPERPDLNQLAPEVRAYIEYLEEQLASRGAAQRSRSAAPVEPSEPPTTMQVITITGGGVAKRTPRHLYGRQRRGGMGVFDLDVEENDPPAFLVIADESDDLILFTDRSRYFRVPVRDLPETEARGAGSSLLTNLSLQPGENLAVVAPASGGSILYLLSTRGWVRRIGASQLAPIKPGTMLEVRQGHIPAAACWGNGGATLVIASESGKGIRFAERQVPVQGGCLGIRLDPSETARFITVVDDEGGVFLLSDEGKGTIRLMSGLRANKSPGAGGKVLMKAERLVGAQAVTEQDDIFAISRLSKIIRFRADEIPAKEGVVQGVNCMSLRADEVVACAVTTVPAP